MSKWGLLRGAGQGMAQAGNMLMADRIDQMKEQRLQKYQEGLQQKQFEREDTIRKEEQGIQMQRDSINQANRLLDRDDQLAREGQAQENFEATFGQSKELVTSQLKQLDQQIEIGGIELEQVRGRDELRKQILAETDPEKQMQLMGDYASLASDFNVEPKTITVYGEIDEMTGQQTRTTMQWDAAQRKWMPVMGGVAGSDRPSIAELLGGQPQAAASNAQGSTAGQSNQTSRGLLNPTLRTEPWTVANAGTGAMESAEADSLTSSQRQQVGQQITMSQRAGQAAAQGVVMAIDNEGKVRALSLSMLQAYLKENPGVKFINGFIEGIGNFNNGRLEQ